MLTALYNIFIGPIELLIEFVFAFLMKPFDNVGFSIIGVSLFVSLITLPLYHIADQLQKKERDQRLALKSGVDRIKAAFKGDEQYMILNTFYKQNNYHPIYALRNSLSLLIQIPFFVAAYNFLSHLTLLKGQGILFISDLGIADTFATIGPITINILPILMTLINLGSAIIYTKGFPFRDRIQTFGISIIFLILLYNSPAGLVFYWTLNNIFSLVKNIFYKLKNPLLVFYLTLVLGISSFVIVVLFTKRDMDLIKKLILISGVIFVIGIPILIKWSTFILNKYLHPFIKSEKQRLLIFLSSSFLIFVLSGIVIPANLISSSPIEFSFQGAVSNPLYYLIHTGTLFIGLTFVWPLTIYLISSKKTRNIISLIFSTLSISLLANVFLFKGKYGDIDNLMVFETASNLEPNIFLSIIPILLIFVISSFILYLICTNKTNIVNTLLTIIIVALFFSGAITIFQISKEFKSYAKDLKASTLMGGTSSKDIVPLIPLSRIDKNVVVIFLDRGVSSYFPIIFDQFSHLTDQYSGFIFYPNTVSYGKFTISGGPPIMGGYEYTPDAMNARDKEKLVDKHNEASLTLPLIFTSNGYRASVFNPPLPNYKWSSDFSAFNNYPEVNVYATRGTFTKYYKAEHIDEFESTKSGLDNIIKNKFPLYNLLKLTLPIIRPLLYDDGTYYLISSDSNSEKIDTFLDDYAELYYFDKFTKIDDNEGSYVFFVNDTPHRPIYLQAPEYTPTFNLTNTYSPLQDYKGFGTKEITHYHANAATILTLGKWFQFLKDEGVYDNTRIILVSDHGYHLNTIPFMNFKANKDTREAYAKYNPILLVKDFDSKDQLLVDYTFMTNGDVPIIAAEGLIEELINPFTNENMREWVNKENVNVYHTPNYPSENRGNKFEFNLNSSFSIKENIFEESNWTPLNK